MVPAFLYIFELTFYIKMDTSLRGTHSANPKDSIHSANPKGELIEGCLSHELSLMVMAPISPV